MELRYYAHAVAARRAASGQVTATALPTMPRLAGVELSFGDLDTAKRFYRDTVGLKLCEEEIGDHAKFDVGSTFLCLKMKKGVEAFRSRDNAVLFVEVPDVRAAVESIGPENVVQSAPDGGQKRWALVLDPEGHSVLLHESPADICRGLGRHPDPR